MSWYEDVLDSLTRREMLKSQGNTMGVSYGSPYKSGGLSAPDIENAIRNSLSRSSSVVPEILAGAVKAYTGANKAVGDFVAQNTLIGGYQTPDGRPRYRKEKSIRRRRVCHVRPAKNTDYKGKHTGEIGGVPWQHYRN